MYIYRMDADKKKKHSEAMKRYRINLRQRSGDDDYKSKKALEQKTRRNKITLNRKLDATRMGSNIVASVFNSVLNNIPQNRPREHNAQTHEVERNKRGRKPIYIKKDNVDNTENKLLDKKIKTREYMREYMRQYNAKKKAEIKN